MLFFSAQYYFYDGREPTKKRKIMIKDIITVAGRAVMRRSSNCSYRKIRLTRAGRFLPPFVLNDIKNNNESQVKLKRVPVFAVLLIRIFEDQRTGLQTMFAQQHIMFNHGENPEHRSIKDFDVRLL